MRAAAVEGLKVAAVRRQREALLVRQEAMRRPLQRVGWAGIRWSMQPDGTGCAATTYAGGPRTFGRDVAKKKELLLE